MLESLPIRVRNPLDALVVLFGRQGTFKQRYARRRIHRAAKKQGHKIEAEKFDEAGNLTITINTEP